MGIERFFSSIQRNEITNLKTSFTKLLEHRLVASHLYIDFNSIIYITLNKVVQDMNFLLFRIITNRYKTDKRCQRVIKEYYLEDYISMDNVTSEKFNKIFSEDGLDKLLVSKVVEYVINIVTNYIEPSKLKLLYVAIDGVPHKAKMVEQKNRRYMGGLISLVHSNIFKQNKNSLPQDRIEYEKYKISWSRNKITPGTPFLHELQNAITSSKFEVKLKANCHNLEQYIYSGPYEPGEGEKKIVDHTRAINLKQSSLVIYSPDSDMTLLGLILNFDIDPSNKIQILRHDQQKDQYSVIDVDLLADNIYSYVLRNLKSTIKPKKSRIVDDIVLMLTVFGNDFVPRLESFSAKTDFTKIIDKYIKVIDIMNGDYLIDHSTKYNRKIIDHKVFLNIIKELSLDEGGNLQHIYISNNYQNYHKLKKIMVKNEEEDNLIGSLNDFLFKLRRFNKGVESSELDKDLDKDKDFITKLKKLTKLEAGRDLSDGDFIKAYQAYYKKYKKPPRVAVTLSRYRNTLDDKMHQDKLNRSLDSLGPNMKITNYDKEMYRFNNMLDDYQKKLQAYKLNLGYVAVDPNTYVWKSEKIVEGVKKYYKEFFNIDNLDVKDAKMNKLVSEYVDGLMWVFDYYYNDFNISVNRSYGDSWFYPYQASPLLTQIYSFLVENMKGGYLLDVSNRLHKYRIPRKDFFNCLEHLMYVSPANLIVDQIPKEYVKFANSSSFYPDLKKAAEDVIAGKGSIVDCRRMIFLNKCHVTLAKTDRDFSKDKKFIAELRRIPLGHDSKERTGEVVDNKSNVKLFTYDKLVRLDEVVRDSRMKGGDEDGEDDDNDVDDEYVKDTDYWKKMYSINKAKYLKSNKHKYKILYKQSKYKLVDIGV